MVRLSELSAFYEAVHMPVGWRAAESLRLSRLRRTQCRQTSVWPWVIIVLALLAVASYGLEG